IAMVTVPSYRHRRNRDSSTKFSGNRRRPSRPPALFMADWQRPTMTEANSFRERTDYDGHKAAWCAPALNIGGALVCSGTRGRSDDAAERRRPKLPGRDHLDPPVRASGFDRAWGHRRGRRRQHLYGGGHRRSAAWPNLRRWFRRLRAEVRLGRYRDVEAAIRD